VTLNCIRASKHACSKSNASPDASKDYNTTEDVVTPVVESFVPPKHDNSNMSHNDTRAILLRYNAFAAVCTT
jgi:hypothetical protein